MHYATGGVKGEGEGESKAREGFLRVGVAQPSSPALHGDDGVTLVQQTETHGLIHSPSQTLIDVLLPYSLVKIRLRLRVSEGINTTVQMRIPSGVGVTGNLLLGG